MQAMGIQLEARGMYMFPAAIIKADDVGMMLS